MAKESALEFLSGMGVNEKALELLRAMGRPQSEEEALMAYVEVAGKVGFDVSREDMLAAILELSKKQAEKTAAAQWSVTGACNLRCRHCFMSAPTAKHGVPTLSELEAVADELAKCGIFAVDITGGEPLSRTDFTKILDLLKERGIALRHLLTNGYLVDEALLDHLEGRGFHPVFQLSFDGLGWHDFLRGIPGAEERAIEAFRLLHRRGYKTAAAMTLHRKNQDPLRDTVLFLSSLGVGHLKCQAAMELGEWAREEVQTLQFSREEELKIYERYIPQYFEDGAPMSINLCSAFSYNIGDDAWGDKGAPEGGVKEDALSCKDIYTGIYIGADGIVAPCMGMTECLEALGPRVYSLRSMSLCDIINDREYEDLCGIRIRDIRDLHPECRACDYAGQCDHGCRFTALREGAGFDGIDPEKCHFFKSGWAERIRAVAGPAFHKYQQQRGT